MTKVLVVDDEPALVTLATYNLEQAGYTVITANDGRNLVETIKTEHIDLVLLDVMLPYKSGIELLREIRAEKLTLPVILITALDAEVDKIVGLEMGADDYVTKPFSPRELIARIKAVMRRFDVSKEQQVVSENKQTFGSLAINYDHKSLTKHGEHVKLTPKEYELLVYLTANVGRVLERETILHGVWGYDAAGSDTRMVDMHMSHLRDKIEDNPKQPEYLRTVRGMGYRFDLPNVAK